MTMQFWLGVFAATAIIAVTVIVWAVRLHFSQERRRRDAFKAFVATKDDEDLIAQFDALRHRVAMRDGPMTAEDNIETAALLKRIDERGIDLGRLLKRPIGPKPTPPPPPPTRKDVY
jgi:anti-sigma-K factor RskA